MHGDGTSRGESMGLWEGVRRSLPASDADRNVLMSQSALGVGHPRHGSVEGQWSNYLIQKAV